MDDANKVLFYEEALQEIMKGEGAYSRHQLTRCENAVENMKEIARKVLIRVKER